LLPVCFKGSHSMMPSSPCILLLLLAILLPPTHVAALSLPSFSSRPAPRDAETKLPAPLAFIGAPRAVLVASAKNVAVPDDDGGPGWLAGVLSSAGPMMTIGGGVQGLGLFFLGQMAFNEQARRSLYFWTMAVPVYLQYKALEAVSGNWEPEKRQAAFEYLHNMHAPGLVNVFLTLRGFYLKVGQSGASREDFVPKQYTERLRTLENAVPAEKGELFARTQVERELGRPISEVFENFEDEPLGSASIGQCHSARLLDGREVVIKVMRPDAERLFRGDLDTLEAFCKLAQPQIVPVFDEFRATFPFEFNYTREAHNLARAAKDLNKRRWNTLRVPKPIMPLCTRTMLVMERLPGVKLVDALRAMGGKEATRRNTTLEVLRSEQEDKREALRMMPTPLAALSIASSGAVVSLARAATRLGNAFLQCFGAGVSDEELPLPFDPLKMLETVVSVHGEQLFEHGWINCDPHPGNVLVAPDGTVGLIDFGQVKYLSIPNRVLYAKFILALAARDDTAIVDAYRKMGVVTRDDNHDVLLAWATILNDRDDPSVLQGHSFQGLMEALNKVDPIKNAPDAFVLIQRATVLLRGCGHALGHYISVAETWAPYARRFLRKHATGSMLGRPWALKEKAIPAQRALVLCGPSGVGKGTIIDRLKKGKDGHMVGFSVSHTTRLPRPGEVNGVHYHFVTHEKMCRGIKEGSFMEHAEVHGNFYGTTFDAVRAVTSAGKVCVLDVDVQGAKACRDKNLDATFVFVMPPSFDELERRLRGRGTESEAAVARRLANAKGELAAARAGRSWRDKRRLFDHVIINEDVQGATDELQALVFPEAS